jgi:lipopolysaccharide/colanic/teichoic acid biosynthesis glycosyltransferase
VSAPVIRPALWSGHEWVDRIRPEHRLLTGRAYEVVKRAFDVVVVVAATPLWLPLMGLIAAWVKLDDARAPVMFVQRRSGRGGKAIDVHKFRTMVPNPEQLKWELRHLNEVEWPLFKITNDPRITRPGRILRKTSLDELPQLWGVLTGRLSLVGPRPNDIEPDEYDLWQTERLDVTPGMTGLWQLYGRGVARFADSNRLDIAYVQRRSLWLDLQILMRTVPAVLTARGAK